jgi:hypothetical protein
MTAPKRRWFQFSLARMLVGLTIAALGMGLALSLWRQSNGALFIGLALVWAGIGLPYMRTENAAVIGLLMAGLTMAILTAWAITHAMTGLDPNF